MNHTRTATPMDAARRETERLKIFYIEEAMLRRVRTCVAERLHEGKILDQSLKLTNKVKELRDSEVATLNILEDTRELELKLEHERNRLTAIIAAIGEGLLVVDASHRIVLINRAGAELLETTPEIALGKDASTIVTSWKNDAAIPNEERPSMRALAGTAPIVITIEDNVFYHLPSGKKFPVALVATPYRVGEENWAVIVFQDVTKEKTLNEARASFVSVASHQLRTPLTAILWSIELLMSKEAGALTDTQKKFAADAYEGTGKLVETINLLLSLARAESGSVQIEPTPVAVADFIRAITTELVPLAAEKELVLTLYDPSRPIPPIMLDAPMLREVIINLLSNAIRYSNPHGTIAVACEAGDDAVTVSVKDNGIGIPASQHTRIFEKFFRADNAVHKTAEGTGLGLNLAKMLIALWHGTIWFTSEEGKGTTFYFTIPYAGMKEKREGKSLVA